MIKPSSKLGFLFLINALYKRVTGRKYPDANEEITYRQRFIFTRKNEKNERHSLLFNVCRKMSSM